MVSVVEKETPLRMEEGVTDVHETVALCVV